MSEFPISLGVNASESIPRWRPLVTWLLLIPHFVWLYVLFIAVAFASFAGWLAALVTGRLPEGIGRFIAGAFRYQWRVTAYLYFFTEQYPSFSFPSGFADPGGDGALLDVRPADHLSRLLLIFKGLLLIPHMVCLYFLGIVASVVGLGAWFAVLFTGRWPAAMRDFMVGVFRWQHRVSLYLYMMTDVYPPFALA